MEEIDEYLQSEIILSTASSFPSQAFDSSFEMIFEAHQSKNNEIQPSFQGKNPSKTTAEFYRLLAIFIQTKMTWKILILMEMVIIFQVF